MSSKKSKEETVSGDLRPITTKVFNEAKEEGKFKKTKGYPVTPFVKDSPAPVEPSVPKPIVLEVPMPLVPVPIPLVDDKFTKFGGWIFKDGKFFIEEKYWSRTVESKAGVIPVPKKPYFDVKSLESFSRKLKKR